MCLFRPGDIVKWKPINRDQYDSDIEAVNANTFLPTIREASFSLAAFNKDINGTNARLMEVLHGH